MSKRTAIKRGQKIIDEVRHVASLAAESDLVKLTREHEALKQELADFEPRRKALHDEAQQAWEESQLVVNRSQELLESITRTERLVKARLQNVNELIAKAVR